MANEILIGTEGWQHAAWRGRFYPEELPTDWEFCYYSNRLRAVSVPADAASGASAADIAQWLQDSDPAFRFVLTVTGAHAADPAWSPAFCARMTVLKPRLAGFIVADFARAPAPMRTRTVQTLAALAPVCIEGAVDDAEQARVWQVEREPAPPWTGVALGADTLCLARMTDGNPRAIRHALERLAAAPTATAGLFFSPSPGAADFAEQARTLAELLGV